MTRLLLASVLLVATPVMAQVYRWVDEKGTVHYSNATPPAAVKFTIIDRDAKYSYLPGTGLAPGS